MCIRDSQDPARRQGVPEDPRSRTQDQPLAGGGRAHRRPQPCLLYTSDAADERSSVDLGGRRIIKKKNTVDRADD